MNVERVKSIIIAILIVVIVGMYFSTRQINTPTINSNGISDSGLLFTVSDLKAKYYLDVKTPYQGGMLGVNFNVTNTSNGQIVIIPSDFYIKKDGANSIKSSSDALITLMPGDKENIQLTFAGKVSSSKEPDLSAYSLYCSYSKRPTPIYSFKSVNIPVTGNLDEFYKH